MRTVANTFIKHTQNRKQKALKNLLLLLGFVTVTGTSVAQSLIWQKNYGGSGMDMANAVQPTLDGGFIMTGMSYSTDGDISFSNGNTWVVKTDSAGAIVWQRCYSDPLYYSNSKSIIATSDSGYAFAGNAVDPSGTNYCFVLKTDDTGKIKWQKNFYGASSGFVSQTADGGYIVGTTVDTLFANCKGPHDFALIRLNYKGHFVWQQTYGDSSEEYLYMVRPTFDGGFIMAGERIDTVYRNSNYYLVKTDSMGVLQWEKTYGGTNDDIAYDIRQTFDGGYILAGVTQSSDGDVTGNHSANPDGADVWVLKTDSAGTIQWQKTLGGSGDDMAYAIVQAADSDYVLTGINQSKDGNVRDNHTYSVDPSIDCWVVKLTPSGNIRWTKSLGGTDMDYGTSISQAKDGSFMIAGYSYSANGDVRANYGQSDYCLFKLDGTPVRTGIASLQGGSALSIYPNPTSGRITLNTIERGTAAVLNLQGQQIASYNVSKGKTALQLPQTVAGIYIIRFLGAESGKADVLRLIYQP